ncbi:transcription factor HIVEP3 [Thalassophryne amazonica]|uniref:transcription factor HIVEP3 n=1 Tax=Thalassophryne amazonica TaxID=390379 RepID=UPI0014721489|nr:transcription factor HIVEP3 [Thalassophryne amazonica]
MEALNSRLATGEQSGGQEHCQPESPRQGQQPRSPSQQHQQQQSSSQKPHDSLQQPKQSRRQHAERKHLRHQRHSIDSDTTSEHKNEATTATTKATCVSDLSAGAATSSAAGTAHSKPETQEGIPKEKRERKPQRPGKYVCTYCGRACAKPSVLQKHIRSHTGERPYPCAPCGFSFKTKSNLYKHRKSHTHRVKAGLALGEPRYLEDQITESEDETRQLSSTSHNTEGEGSVSSIKSHETHKAKDCSGVPDDSYAVKKRLAMRLSRGKHGPAGSSAEKAVPLILGSKGSTESGYFSHSESIEQSQDSPPSTSAKSYAEIILGKYGRLGQLQRMSRHQNQQPSVQDDKSIPFTLPKKQVIDHITNLITINEAVVDTSKIDSVKPRRFSLSRKNSSESQKSPLVKEPVIHTPKPPELCYKSSGSITMGVPCEKFQHQALNVEQPSGQTSTSVLLRSHSMPLTATSFDAPSGTPSRFCQSHSYDERQPSEMQASRHYGMLRRQPAIEIPLSAELTNEEYDSSQSFYSDSLATVPDHKQSQSQPYECEVCGTGCKNWEGYKEHKQSLCLAHHPATTREKVVSQKECSQLLSQAVRPGMSLMRKRRKEESFEFDDPSSLLPSQDLSTKQSKDGNTVAYEAHRRATMQTCSVIQHTSSFEKQDSLCIETQVSGVAKTSPPHKEHPQVPQKQQQSTKLTTRKLVRQHNVQVPEILVTEDSSMSIVTSMEPTSTAKQAEKLDEFHWPQRSTSLAQLPIEKLPPKKKRLRLAEATQSSGESSFDSVCLSRSPSQDSSASYASSRSTSFEETNRPDMETVTSTPLRRSRASHMLTVPGVPQHREMRRSASEQAPHEPQAGLLMAETRSKSFDYSSMSPERSAAGWRERRKCLLIRHSAVRDPDEEEKSAVPSHSPEPVTSCVSSQASQTSVYGSRLPSSPVSGDTVIRNTVQSSEWKVSQTIQLTDVSEGSLTHGPPVDTLKESVSHMPTGQRPHRVTEPNVTRALSGAARAHYLPVSTGLKLEIPSQHSDYPGVREHPVHVQHSLTHVTSCLELLRPPTSAAVAVRVQMDTLTPASAIYTTLSQSASAWPREALDAVSHHIGVPAAECRHHKDTSVFFQVGSEEGLRPSGSGGNKRMLSPSNSIELSPESEQQQKRVKEEEEREVKLPDKATVADVSQELSQSCTQSVTSLMTHTDSFPTLLSSTCNSWCYLNYIKPNPSALDEQKPSVYSSWSTSGYDPNPPGLSSKTALALLHCKQRLSPSIYTISPMSAGTTESMEQEDNKTPSSTQVCSSWAECTDREETRKKHQSAEDSRSNVGREESEEKKSAEEEEEESVAVQSSSRNKEPPRVWTPEGRQPQVASQGSARFAIPALLHLTGPEVWGLSTDWVFGRIMERLRCFVSEEQLTDFDYVDDGLVESVDVLIAALKKLTEKVKCLGLGLSQIKIKIQISVTYWTWPMKAQRAHAGLSAPVALVSIVIPRALTDSLQGAAVSVKTDPPQCLHTYRSHEECSVVEGGGGTCGCEDGARRCQSPSELPKCPQPSAEPPGCQGNGHKERSDQSSDVGKRQGDEDDDVKHVSRDENEEAKVVESPPASCDDGSEGHAHLKPDPSRTPRVTPKESTQKTTVIPASVRRALFARRRLEPSASTRSRGSYSPRSLPLTPQSEGSPPRSPSPRPLQPPASSQHSLLSSVSTTSSLLRLDSPSRVQSRRPGSSGPSGFLEADPAQCRGYPHPKEQPTASLSVDQFCLTHVNPNLTRPRGSNILSHLPLHSQQPSRAPSLLIPIGGIHMIQPRSTLPHYSLVSSPAASPAGTQPLWRRRLSDGRLSVQCRAAIKETEVGSRAGSPHPETAWQTAGALPDCQAGLSPSDSGEDRVTERCVYPETTRGQKKAPSSRVPP